MIMEAKELRIGNLFRKHGVVVTLDGRSIFDIWSSENGGSVVYYNPIQITERWLLKFGFEKSGDYWMKSNSGFFFGIKTDGTIMYLFDEGMTCPANIKYVHQLQNLIHALTGKELEIREHNPQK